MLNQKLNWLDLDRRGFFNVILGSFIMAFTVVNIHVPAQLTSGGILGVALFSYKVFGLNPSTVNLILDICCLLLGISIFGKKFLKRTLFASLAFALAYSICDFFGPILPSLYDYPMLAALVGGLGIGIGCGLVITQGGAAGGDDTLALIISNKAKVNIAISYLLIDAVALGLSLAYIPFGRLVFSLITTTVSSILVGQFDIKLPTAMETKNA